MRGAIAAWRRVASPARTNLAPQTLLAAAALISGTLLVDLGSRLTWRYDDWDVLLFRPGWSAHSLLAPHYEHITFTQIVIYKALAAVFGIGSLLPFNIAAILVFVGSAVLLFFYLRTRVGAWLALMGATVILFLGAAAEDLLWPIGILVYGPVAFGLAMLLALQREDRTGDRLACLFLTLSISFFSVGLAFAAGAAVDIGQRRESWRSRAYIIAIPALLYAVWWLGWGHTASNSLSLHDIGAAPLYVLDAMAAGVGSLFGLANPTSVSTVQGSLVWGRPLLLLFLALAAWRMYRLERLSRWFWIVTAIAFATWILAAFGSQTGRPPDSSRYQYASSIYILLIAAELTRGLLVKRGAMIAVLVVATASVMGGLTQLFDAYKGRKTETAQTRGALSAMEIARHSAGQSFEVAAVGIDPVFFAQNLPWTAQEPVPSNSPAPAGTTEFTIGSGAYFKAIDEFGSPAYSEAELADSREAAREVADIVFGGALDIKLKPTQQPATGATGQAPTLVGPREALAGRSAGCLHLAASGVPPLLELPRGGATLTAGPGSGFQVRLRRYSTGVLPLDLGNLAADSSAVVDIPTDRSSEPWKLSLDGTGPVDVCGIS